MITNNIKELSIQISLNGLSFCILNRDTSTIEFLHRVSFQNKLTPYELLQQLKNELSDNLLLSDTFDRVVVIHQNELATLVPSEFYDEQLKADYLKFNTKILKSDFISHDNLKSHDSVCVYVPYVNINNYIFDTFGAFTYTHATTLLVDSIYKRHLISSNIQNTIYIHLSTTRIDIVVLEGKTLHLANSFEYYSKEDFIYYVLFVFEQLQLNTETDPILLSGIIKKDDAYYQLLYKYVRHVELATVNYAFKVYKQQHINDLQSHYLILNSF